MSDAFHAFFEKLERGDFAQAIALILPRPDSSYDQLFSNEPAFHYLINYIDAALFEDKLWAEVANRCLLSFFKRDPTLQERYPRAFIHLQRDTYLLEFAAKRESKGPEISNSWVFFHLLVAEREQKLLSEEKKKAFLQEVEPFAKDFLEREIALSQGWAAFQKMKPEVAALCSEGIPWYPLRYFQTPISFTVSSSQVPLLFLEPLECDFSFLAQLKNRPALFAFETTASFLQMLQFPDVVEALGEPDHLIYILDLYPNAQFAVQTARSTLKGSFAPFLLYKKKQIEPVFSLLVEAISACAAQPEESFHRDTETGNWLYQIAKRYIFSTRQARLGVSRAPALLESVSMEKWSDPHKEQPSPEKPLGPAPQDFMALRLNQLAEQAYPKPRKVRLVHIVPQVIDGGHAPSRLLENLIVHHDRSRFELFLISSERMQFRFFDYPFNMYVSRPSEERAEQRLALFRSLGVNVQILFDPTYERTARSIAEFLHQSRADIAVFHGPDVINYMAAQLTEAPLRVLFEHGTPPTYPGFDLAILSSMGAVEIYRDPLAKIGTQAVGLPFHLDVRGQWEEAPYPKDKLGLPPDSLLMTTISNHLESRLGHEMCLAIAEILTAVPNAYYVPIGRISEEGEWRFKKFFTAYGVGERVKFLGSVARPSQYARSMLLYLNEFPFGSCLSMLDAMASGVPLVTMYDLHGPPQARYGGEFMGLDHAIASCKKEEYVALACKLLTDPLVYREWSEYTKNQYEKHADVPSYVSSFEEIVVENYHRKH